MAITCPIKLKSYDAGTLFVYDFTRDEHMSDFSKRLILDWGEGYRSWVQRPEKQNKDVVEIRRQLKSLNSLTISRSGNGLTKSRPCIQHGKPFFDQKRGFICSSVKRQEHNMLARRREIMASLEDGTRMPPMGMEETSF